MKKIRVKVAPGAKKSRIVENGDHLKVYVTARAVEGKANAALIEMLAEHFSVRKSSVRIVSGEFARIKQVEIA